jgi:type IV pilus assembly protein PilN
MIRINLLGQPRPKKARRAGGAPMEGSLQVIFLIVALVLGLGGLFVHYGMLNKQLKDEQKEVTRLNGERARLTQIKAEVDQREREKSALKQRIAVIEELQRNRTGAQELLDALANTVNRVEALWMTSMTRKGNSLTMDGAADSLNAVANFITQLKRSGYFDKVEIKESKQDERRTAITTFLFTLTADFALSGQNPPGQPAPAGAKAGKS